MSEAMKTQARERAASRVASAGAAVAVGLGAWAVLDRRPVASGLLALAAGGLLLAGGVFARGDGMVLERALDSFIDRAFDGCLLGSIAWVERASSPAVSAAALVALGASFLSAYIRARGSSLGYSVEESPVTRGLRYGLVGVGLAAGWLDWALWVLAGSMLVAALVRASQVAKEERI